MNLSDLVHRTAGDNKVLTTASNFETSTNVMITPPSTSQPPSLPPSSSSSSFEHNKLELESSSFQRQQQEAYLFPMQAAANWTPQAFLQHQHQQQQLQLKHKETSRIPIEQKKVLLDVNIPYQQNPFTFTTNTIAKPVTQKIAPVPPPHSFSNNSNHSNISSISSNSTNSSNNITSISNISNNNNNGHLSNNNNNSNNSNNNISTQQDIKVFHQQSIAPYPRNVFQVYAQQPSPSTQYNVPIATTNTTTTTTTAATAATTVAANTSTNGSTTTSSSSNGLVPIAPLQTVEEPKKPTVIITGDNVDANNLEEGYIQFVLRHDANYIGDGIESLMYAKRKFSSVPKTGDLSYTTWDIFQLVQKLYTQEIRNWSQLVGQLGLADMAGRPQFAQRVKRWMHKYKIDCYFDYLLGNDYNFNSPDEKYSGCLMMGNYQKRKSENGKRTDETDSVKSSEDEHIRRPRKRFSDDDIENDDGEDSDDTNRIPILLAGSRKRMRDTSQNSLQMIENARQFMRTANQSEDEDEEMDEKRLEDDDDDGNGVLLDKNQCRRDNNSDSNGEEEEEDGDEETTRNESNLNSSTLDSPMIDNTEIDEEDELASTCSSPDSALLDINSNTHIPLDDAVFSPSPSSPHSNTDDTAYQNISSNNHNSSSCSNCNGYTMESMKSEMAQLKSYVNTLEAKLEQQTKLNESNTKQIEKLLDEKQKLRSSTEKWKRKLIEDLVRGPKLLSDDDDDLA